MILDLLGLDSIIESISTLWSYIKDFIGYMFKLPIYLSTWYESLPSFISTGMFILMLLVTTIVVIKIINIIKGVVS